MGYYYPYYYYYDPTFILIIIGAIISLFASLNIKWTFFRYNKKRSTSGFTAKDVAEMILSRAGIYGVRIEHISGELTDHYDPRADVVRLSDSVYNSTSIAAIGVAAHECGHVIQYHKNYKPIYIRNSIVGVVNFGSYASMPLFMIGLILGKLALAKIGVLLFSLTLVFQLITLPVEINASRRAIKILSEGNYMRKDELKGAKKVLIAAALTYVAAVLTSLLQVLRFLLIIAANSREEE
ncbi:zinc metallopeptidase [Lachnobacterium bovis]|uniref:zinc metallopeptidase n=1 Tax=Lachnobacterium bovis TaxID=140626 RepID=UPI000485D3EA|nr:zinc metallopeptidase [Lachnobacterium bovis]